MLGVPERHRSVLVYITSMANETENIHDRVDTEVVRAHEEATGQKDVNLGARYPEAKRISVEEARALKGIGWEGDLQEMRSTRFEKI